MEGPGRKTIFKVGRTGIIDMPYKLLQANDIMFPNSWICVQIS